MAKVTKVEDLNDGRYAEEPRKRLRVLNPEFDVKLKNSATNPKYLYEDKPKWSPNSRHLMIHLFYGILGEKKPRSAQGKLPSIDEEALVSMKNPIAMKLVTLRKQKKVLEGLMSVDKFLLPDKWFIGEVDSQFKVKALFRFDVHVFDNVERIFTQAKRSISLNIPKMARRAFVCPIPTVDEGEISCGSLSILRKIEGI